MKFSNVRDFPVATYFHRDVYPRLAEEEKSTELDRLLYDLTICNLFINFSNVMENCVEGKGV